jgi:L-idonate 5-dehydrogenase
MRAVVIHAAHDLRVDDRPMPERAEGEVLVRIRSGGICGSDLHYYHDGGFGVVRVREPMALGHEIAGVIEEVGSEVSHLVPGMRVAVSPSLACGQCRYCREGLRLHCLDMRFMGSAMRFPHVQGGFREYVCVDASQAVPIADSMTMGEAAMAEPLAVCLHAANRAGPLQGKRVLVTGAGPIGMLCMMVARQGGAAEVVMTDIADAPLATASRLGADKGLNMAADPEALKPYAKDKGSFDVLFECSGAAPALRSALEALKPRGIIVQVGIGGDMLLPMNTMVTKEFDLRGTFRFEPEFALAVALMGKGLIDVKPLISATMPFTDAVAAFDLASDKTRSMKVQLAF